MEGNPHVDINKEQKKKKDSKTVNRFFVKSQRGRLQKSPGFFFSFFFLCMSIITNIIIIIIIMYYSFTLWG